MRLLALATLSASFVLPPRQHLAVRIRAESGAPDEIEAADDAAAPAERVAPEVNSGAEAVELSAEVKLSPPHAIDATG